jgi:hypothetical protein
LPVIWSVTTTATPAREVLAAVQLGAGGDDVEDAPDATALAGMGQVEPHPRQTRVRFQAGAQAVPVDLEATAGQGGDLALDDIVHARPAQLEPHVRGPG